MRFNIHASVLVIGVTASCILSAPVPDQPISSSTTSIAPTNTPNNNNDVIGPVNNGQNSNQNNNQNNNVYGNNGLVTVPIAIDPSVLQQLLSGGSQAGNSGNANIIHKNVVSANQLPPGAIPFNQFVQANGGNTLPSNAIPFSQFVQANGGNIPPPNADNVHVVQAGFLPPQQALVNNVNNNNPTPSPTPTTSTSTTTSATTTSTSSQSPPSSSPPAPADDSDSSDDAQPQKRQEWQIRNPANDHNTNLDETPDFSCSKRDSGCGWMASLHQGGPYIKTGSLNKKRTNDHNVVVNDVNCDSSDGPCGGVQTTDSMYSPSFSKFLDV